MYAELISSRFASIQMSLLALCATLVVIYVIYLVYKVEIHPRLFNPFRHLPTAKVRYYHEILGA